MTETEIKEALARAERAYEELMRVTGMGKYAKRVQGGPPNPPRCSIPARPDYDTDLLIGEALEDSKRLAADLLAARAERDEARAAWKLAVERPTKEELRSALARAETAEARCRELEWALRDCHLAVVDGQSPVQAVDRVYTITSRFLSPPPSPEATPFEADTMTHEDAPCATCGGRGTVCAVPDGYHHGCANPAHAKPCPDCGGGD